jgi:4-hydroxybenzoate polyprenyltransferase
MNDWSENDWISHILPKKWHIWARLMRLDRPIGIWLLLIPCYWSFAATGQMFHHKTTLILFTLGAIVMRASGCIVNDILDRDLDSKVARTSQRPIASKKISLKQALMVLLILLFMSLIILLQFNYLTIILGCYSLFLVAIYPLMKRLTYWPQAWLGLTFNWGVWLGWTAITNNFGIIPFILYGAGFFWTLAYDTIYAHQDKNDDQLVGILSTARLFGDKTKIALVIFFTLSLGLIAIAVKMIHASLGLYIIPYLGAVLHALWQIYTLNIHHSNDCLKKFKSNRDYGLLILLSLVL